MQTQETLRQLSSQVDSVVGSLRMQSEDAATAQVEREQRMAAQADETVENWRRSPKALWLRSVP